MSNETDVSQVPVQRLVRRRINGRCYVCNKIDRLNNLVNAVFGRDEKQHHGHLTCFNDVNEEGFIMGSTRRWHIVEPSNAQDHRACAQKEPK